MDPQPSAPPVVAVIVTCDPGAWFEEALASLAEQDYPNLSVLVVDADSADDPTLRIASVIPHAYVRRLARRVGFGQAANDVLGIVEGASHFLFCHDDVALAPDAVRLMVEEAFRSNAGIVCPKMVDWDQPARLLAVGATADRLGGVHPLIELGELDQEQHDAVRDVFVAPGGATLVRADLFSALAGYDPGTDLFGEDLNLCWRAQIAGARVIVAPSARVRHLQAIAEGQRLNWGVSSVAKRRNALGQAHRVRTLLTCASFGHLLWLVPYGLFLSVVHSIFFLVMGQPRLAGGTLSAWPSSLRRPLELWKTRRKVQASRSVADSEIAQMQLGGVARLRSMWAERLATMLSSAGGGGAGPLPPGAGGAMVPGAAGLRRAALAPTVARNPAGDAGATIGDIAHGGGAEPTGSDAVGSGKSFIGVATDPSVGARFYPSASDHASDRSGAWRVPLGLAAGVILIMVLGGRSLLFHHLPAVGQLPTAAGGPTAWWHDFVSAWRPQGLGSASPAPPALALLSLFGRILLDNTGLLQQILVLGAFAVGPLGAWRAARPFGSQWARVTAVILYVAIPLPYNALAEGRWGGLCVYAAAPWILSALGRLARQAPFVAPAGRPERWGVARIVGSGAALAVLAAFVPAILVIVPLMALAMVPAGLLAGDARNAVRGLIGSLAASVIAAALLMPWTSDVLSSRTSLFGVALGSGGRLPLGDILRFHTGPLGGSPLDWGFVAAGALPLLLGRSWRFSWAIRLWAVALACWGVVWAAGMGWLSLPLANPEVLLAPAAAALALAGGLGVVAFEVDLPGYRLGWRQVASAVAGLAVVAALLPLLGATTAGNWHLPSADESGQLQLPSGAHGAYRVLWVGDPSALPLGSWWLGNGMGYATSINGMPTLSDLWAPREAGATPLLAADLRLARDGRTTRLGHLLAAAGVRFIVVPDQTAPSTSGGLGVRSPGDVLAGLSAQVDLRSEQVDPSLTVYQNAAWSPLTETMGSAGILASKSADPRVLQDTNLAAVATSAGARPVVGTSTSTAPNVSATYTYVSSSFDRHWRLVVGNRSIRPKLAFGWAMLFGPSRGTGANATGALDYRGLARRWWLGLELAAWMLVLGGLTVARVRRSRVGIIPSGATADWSGTEPDGALNGGALNGGALNGGALNGGAAADRAHLSGAHAIGRPDGVETKRQNPGEFPVEGEDVWADA